MIKYIKNSLAKHIARIFPGLVSARGKEELNRVRSLTNVGIADNVALGEGTSIYTEGIFKQLTLKQGVFFRKFCNILIYPNAMLVVDENVFFNNYCSINCLGQIEIGAKTVFGEGVKIYDHNHKYHYEKDGTLVLEKDEYTIGHVRIGKNCWIGSNVTILSNVEIGDNVIIGANCLIYKSIPANSIVKHEENLIITHK